MNSGMKKNENLLTIAFFLPLFFLFFIVTGCSSLSQKSPSPEQAAALLDKDASLFLSIPVKANKVLATDLVAAMVNDISEKQAQQLVSSLENVYASVTQKSNTPTYRLSATGKFPVVSMGALFTKANGWNVSTYKASRLYTYYSRENTDLKICLPNSRTVFTSSEIRSMIDDYDARKTVVEKNIPAWITQPGDDILFYMPAPQNLIKKILGTEITFGIVNAYGSLALVSSQTNDYSICLDLQLGDKRFLKSAVVFIGIAAKKMNAEVDQLDDDTIQISGLTVSESNILKWCTAMNMNL